MSTGAARMNPFPGLRPFTQEEDFLFFGREEQTLELLQRLGGNRFVAVVGTSGSGKSSLVRCGLLSELLGGRMLEAGASWEIAVTHPGGNPLALLTEALLEADLYDREQEHARENLLATLSRSHFGLVEAVRQAGLGEGVNFLLVVDQFEEIFRFHEAGQWQQEAASEFVSLLLEATSQRDVPIYVVLTMRSDFIGECGQFEGLAEMVNRGEFLIPRLHREQFKRVIEGPIKVAGGQIAPRLLQRLLNDLGQQADQLPCLQHALMRTWDVWSAKGDSEALDLDDYHRVGKMSQALSLHADEIYESLANDRQRELCKGIFQALTVEESNNRGIRRPQRLGRLCQILEAPAGELLPIINAYRQSGVTFLTPAPEVVLSEQTIIDISHESLMRVWTRLRQWVEEETQATGIYQRLSESADLHDVGKAGLYRDPELGIALAWREAKRPNAAWAERYRPGFARAIAFLEASQQAALAEEQAREAARQRELEQARKLAEAERHRAELEQRAARRLRGLAAAMAVVAVFAFGASLVAANFWWAADAARKTAQRSELAARESAAVAQREAERAQREAERAAAQEALARAARDEAEVRAYTASLAAAAADLQRNDSRTLRRRLEQAPPRLRGWEWTYLWNESDRSLQTTLSLPAASEGYRMDLSADGKLVAVRPAGGNDRPVMVFDTRTGEPKATLTTYSSSHPLMTFSADNRLLAYHHHGTPGVQIFEVETGRALAPRPHDFRAFLGFAPAGERAYLLDADGKILAFKTADWSLAAELPGTVLAGDFRRRGAVSPKGNLLAISAFGADPMRIFDINANTLLHEIADAEAAVAMKFSDAGNSLTTISNAGVITEYAAPTWKEGAQTQEARQQRGSLALHLLDGQLLRLSFDANGAVVLFDPQMNRSATLRGRGAPGESIAVDQERSEIVTTHRDGSVCRWDLRHPRDLRIASQAVAFTRDGSAVYAGLESSSQRGALQLAAIDAMSGSLQGFLRWFPWSVNHGSQAAQIAYSPDGRRAALATRSGWGQGRWRIYDLWTGLADPQVELPKKADLDCIDWSADGKWIAVGGKSYGDNVGSACIYNGVTRDLLAQLDCGAGGVHAVAFSRDSQRLFTAAEDGTLRVWGVPGGQLQSTFGRPGEPAVTCLANSPDGSYLVAGQADGAVAAWTLPGGKQLFREHVHGAAVKCLAFTPDGSRLLSAGADNSLKVFDPAAGRELLALHLENSAEAMTFSPDGKRLLLAAGSLLWLEAEPETECANKRRLAREANERVTALLRSLAENAKDPLQLREQILARSGADQVLRQEALRRLRMGLDSWMREAYRLDKLKQQVNLQVLRHQIALEAERRATQDQGNQLRAAVEAIPNLEHLERQALAEFVSALLNWPLEWGSEQMAWAIVSNPARDPNDQLVAYFGVEPLKRRGSPDASLLKTVAWAEYRAGLYADALETARRGLALAKNASPQSAHLLAVIALCEHGSGQTEAAAETQKRLEETLQGPAASADQESRALSQEVRTVLAAPPGEAWNAQAAWEACQKRLAELQLDQARLEAWLAGRNTRIFVAQAAREVREGEWKHAAANYQKAIEPNERADSSIWMTPPTLWAYAENAAGHQQACQKMFERFRKSTAPNDTERLLKTMLLLENGPELPADQVQKFVASIEKASGSIRIWYLATQGLLECRKGNHAEAHARIDEALALEKKEPNAYIKALAISVRSLAFARQKDALQAQKSLDELKEVLTQDLKMKWQADGRLEGSTILNGETLEHDKLIPEILRKEAVQLLAAAAGAPGPPAAAR